MGKNNERGVPLSSEAPAPHRPRPRPHELLTAGYLVVTGFLVATLGTPPTTWWPVLAAHGLGVVAAVALLPLLDTRGWQSVVRDWLPVAVLPLLYTEIPRLNQLISTGYHDHAIRAVEFAVFQAPPRITLRQLLPWRPFVEYLHFSYVAYYLLLPILGGALYLRGRLREFRFMLATVLATFYACYLCFIIYPVAGPWYRVPHPDMASVGLFFPALVHDLLVAGAAKGAAFPSSHVAVAVVIWLLAWRLTRPVFWLLAAIVPALALGTVYGGFHYAVDSAAGALVGVAGFLGGPYVHRFLGGDSFDSAASAGSVSREPHPGHPGHPG